MSKRYPFLGSLHWLQHTSDEKQFSPLTFFHFPLALSFALYSKDGASEAGSFVLDPAATETLVASASLVVFFNNLKEIVYCLSKGSQAWDDDALGDALETAQRAYFGLYSRLNELILHSRLSGRPPFVDFFRP